MLSRLRAIDRWRVTTSDDDIERWWPSPQMTAVFGVFYIVVILMMMYCCYFDWLLFVTVDLLPKCWRWRVVVWKWCGHYSYIVDTEVTVFELPFLTDLLNFDRCRPTGYRLFRPDLRTTCMGRPPPQWWHSDLTFLPPISTYKRSTTDRYRRLQAATYLFLIGSGHFFFSILTEEEERVSSVSNSFGDTPFWRYSIWSLILMMIFHWRADDDLLCDVDIRFPVIHSILIRLTGRGWLIFNNCCDIRRK